MKFCALPDEHTVRTQPLPLHRKQKKGEYEKQQQEEGLQSADDESEGRFGTIRQSGLCRPGC